MSNVNLFAELVAAWAATNPKIDLAYLVGSRAEGTSRADSDLDVAITLVEGCGYTDWFYESDDWIVELQKMMETKIHLLRGGGSLPNEVVEQAILDHGILVYKRKK